MRRTRIAAVIAGLALATILGTTEIVCIIAGATTAPALRMWTLTIVALTLLGPLGLCVLERQTEIRELLAEIRDLLKAIVADSRAEKDFQEIKKRLGGQRGADNITHLYPEE